MQRRWFKRIRTVVGLVFLIGASVLVWRTLRHDSLAQILRQLQLIPTWMLLAAFAGTAIVFALLFLYDFLSLRLIGKPLAPPKIAIASFLANAFGHTIGFPAVVGGVTRLHLYGEWGLTALQATQVLALTWIPALLGLTSLCGLFFVLGPIPLPPHLVLPVHALRPLGAVLLAPAVLYLGVSSMRLTFHWRHHRIRMPGIRIALDQLLLGVAKWGIQGLILYGLFRTRGPTAMAAFGTRYCLAQVAAVLSHAPGGLGVFDAALIYLLAHDYAPDEVAGVLLAYRAIFNLIPLLAASGLLFGVEWKKPHFQTPCPTK